MYIAVFRYGLTQLSDELESGNMCILDTNDGVVECVRVEDVINSGISVENYEFSDGSLRFLELSGYYCIPYNENGMFSREKGEYDSFGWMFRSDGILHVVYLESKGGYINFVVDNITIPVHVAIRYDLSYMFRWRNCTVLRFYKSCVGLTVMYAWFTIIISDSGEIDYYDMKYENVSNKALAMQLDMSSEV